ncbi:MAG: amidohydrolase family protein [Proteobacteria bacterium]|nr:amidohydrolase family protein [Pseudomonadota bacterium]
MALIKKLTDIPLIDTHVHVFPPKISEAIKRWFEKNAWRFNYLGTVEELIQLQFDSGVAGLILLNYAHRPGIAGELNGFIGHLIRRFPHTAGLATFHPKDEESRDILKQAFEEFGLCGLKLHCHVQRTAPDDPILFPIYEAILEFNGVLNIHAGREPAIQAYGIDVRAITGADRVERVLQRYPDLKMIIPHLGFDESDRFYTLLDRYPNLYLDTTMMMGDFFQTSVHPESLIRHADRILYGSDFPHIPYGLEREVEAILNMDLGEEVTRKIFFENATKVFPIAPRVESFDPAL